MKPGDKFLVMFEVKRLAQPNEVVNGVKLGPNFRQNIWISEPVGFDVPKLTICSDHWGDKLPFIPPGLEGANFKT